MKTLQNYLKSNHKIFTHELLKIENKIISVYKNKGYTKKSRIYGVIYQIHTKLGGLENVLSFKTKKQVVKFLESKKW